MLKTKPLVTASISQFLPIMCTSQVYQWVYHCLWKDMLEATGCEASQLRAEVVGTIKSAKIPQPNVSKEERDAIKLLQKEKSVKILGADKGRATVVMDTEEYEEKLANMLNDTNTYMKLDKDPTPKYKKKLVEIISHLEREEKIKNPQKGQSLAPNHRLYRLHRIQCVQIIGGYHQPHSWQYVSSCFKFKNNWLTT